MPVAVLMLVNAKTAVITTGMRKKRTTSTSAGESMISPSQRELLSTRDSPALLFDDAAPAECAEVLPAASSDTIQSPPLGRPADVAAGPDQRLADDDPVAEQVFDLRFGVGHRLLAGLGAGPGRFESPPHRVEIGSEVDVVGNGVGMGQQLFGRLPRPAVLGIKVDRALRLRNAQMRRLDGVQRIDAR